ncbi:hypothetical protein C8J56DRAFT_1172207 [Mycena floridula]|nr:hypothetical protein C8J56DRAFT_1175058 [Mycena floridula]KAJ7575350.1 hypothetical protein C8J56DRAFT_1172207 [Mycena floridula]
MDSSADMEIDDANGLPESWCSEDWIGKGRQYKGAPSYVSSALQHQCCIPVAFQSALPAPHLPVADFPEIQLPDITSDIHLEYSTDPPDDMTINLLRSLNPIPSKSNLLDLENSMDYATLGLLRFAHLPAAAFLLSLPESSVRTTGPAMNQLEVLGSSGKLLDELFVWEDELRWCVAELTKKASPKEAEES